MDTSEVTPKTMCQWLSTQQCVYCNRCICYGMCDDYPRLCDDYPRLCDDGPRLCDDGPRLCDDDPRPCSAEFDIVCNYLLVHRPCTLCGSTCRIANRDDCIECYVKRFGGTPLAWQLPQGIGGQTLINYNGITIRAWRHVSIDVSEVFEIELNVVRTDKNGYVCCVFEWTGYLEIYSGGYKFSKDAYGARIDVISAVWEDRVSIQFPADYLLDMCVRFCE